MNQLISKPVIKPFLYKSHYYVYDAYSNFILNVSKDDYLRIIELEQIGENEYIKKHNFDLCDNVIHLINKGYFKSNFIDKIENPFINQYRDLLDSNVSDITLQVTRNCNFRCRYCSYSTNNNIGRVHDNEEMSWSIAKRSIDFLYNHSTYSESVVIAFYGGEPLLNFKLIQQVVTYSQALFKSKQIKYVMTINGSLLTKEIVDFIVSYNFILSVSFDGPQSLQNNHRRFRDSGRDTYDVVFRNIKDFKIRYPDYFRKNVHIISVLFDDEAETDTLYFIEKELGVNPSNINIQAADMTGVDYLTSKRKLKRSYSTESFSYTEKKTNGILANIYEDKSPINSIWHHRGPCVPGVKRLFVDIYGNLYPCEKCIEAKFLMIGNIFDGFDINKIHDYIDIGRISEKTCKQCWALRFCDICALRCYNIDNNKFDLSTKKLACEQEMKKTLKFFEHLIDERKMI